MDSRLHSQQAEDPGDEFPVVALPPPPAPHDR